MGAHCVSRRTIGTMSHNKVPSPPLVTYNAPSDVQPSKAQDRRQLNISFILDDTLVDPGLGVYWTYQHGVKPS